MKLRNVWLLGLLLIVLAFGGVMNVMATMDEPEAFDIEGEGTGDICDFGTFNCSIVENCQFVPKSTTMASAISTDDCKESMFINNRFTSGAGDLVCDYGIKFNGGADKYVHNTIVEGNIINGAVKAAGTGIYVASDCTGSGSVFRKNIIRLTGAGTGIDENSDNVMIFDNYVFHVAGDAYDINAALAAQNIDNNNGTVIDEPSMG